MTVDDVESGSPGRETPTVIAHRGFAGRYPENTVAAAVAAARDGADMVEVDVLPCADDTVVVFHDERLDAGDGSRGVTDAAGTVWETDCETVLAAEVLESGETVPTLADVAAALPPEVGLNVELKHPGVPDVSVLPAGSTADRTARRRRWVPFVRRVLEALDEFEGEVLLSSFDETALAAARELDPSVPVAVIFADDAAAGLEAADRLDADAVHPPVDAVVWTPDRGPATGAVDIVAVAHEAGYDVNVWTVETWYEAVRLREAGVDGVIADYPDLFESPGA